MADQLLKTVRITSDIKLEVYQQGRRRKYAIFYDFGKDDPYNIRNSSENTKTEKYDSSMSDDDIIKEALGYYNRRFGSYNRTYKIIQDPYKDPITKRVYGETPYYLNNGCKIVIQWLGQKPNPEFTLGTFSNPEDADYYYKKETNDVKNGPKRFLRSTTESPIFLTSNVDDAGKSDNLPKSSWIVAGTFSDISIFGSNGSVYGPDYRDQSYVYDKEVNIYLPDGFTENGGKGYLVWTNNRFQYNTKASPKGGGGQEIMLLDGKAVIVTKRGDFIQSFPDYNKDSDIIGIIISYFKGEVSKIHGISFSDYNLSLCSPDTGSCSVIPYKSPLEPPNNTPTQAAINETPPGPTQSSTKIKLTIQGLFDSGDGITPGTTSPVFEIKAKTDMPTFTIWAGDIPKTEQVDEFDDLEELDDEYFESDFRGEEETGLNAEVWNIQNNISNEQEDSDKNSGIPGSPAEIKPYSSFDQLIELAGKCARELGKNARVNSENMKKGYTKGIHGLCPQGTQAVLYALTGIKAVGKLSGNADNFSFGSTNPSSSNRSSFSSSGYYNDKVKISQIGGSWKGTYLHKDSKSTWQIGDVIAMAYSGGKNYGHIQVWTGFSWMSDFKQGNSIQQNHVNENSVALWRLNEKGVDAVKKQQGKSA